MRPLLLLLLALACTPKPPVPPVPPPGPDPFEKLDAAPAPANDVTCAAACERLWALGCKAGRPTPKGATCLEVCANATDSGIITWNLFCIAHADSCPATDRCR